MKNPLHARAGRLAALLAAALSLQASLAAQNQSSSAAAADNNSIVSMSAFEVTTTQGHGYSSTNSASAFKTDESLMNIPQADIVVTNDFIKDVGYYNTTDVLAYFGLAAGFQGEADLLRGASVGYPYIDDMPVHTAYMDNAPIDSYQIIKGPSEGLYINGPLQGLVLKSTKKPLPFDQDILTAKMDAFGLYRFTGDFTGPIGSVGDAKVGYRFVAVYQDGKTYWQNVKNKSEVVFPAIEVDYHNTTLRLNWDIQHAIGVSGNMCLLTPSGGLYTGAGRNNGNQPPNNGVLRTLTIPGMQVLQKISDNWETRVSAIFSRDLVYGGNIGVLSYDWAQQQETFLSDIYNQKEQYWSVIDDTTGKYTFGPSNWEMKNVDAFGYGFTSITNKEQYWTTAPFYDNGVVTVPFNSAADINAIVVPPSSAYPAPANAGEMFETTLSSIYFQHSIEIIPNWLTLLAAFTWDNSSSTSITNISTLPWNGTVVSVSQWLHRLGAVLHVTQNVSIYALDSTTFTPPGSGSILENGLLPPDVIGTGSELGLKWNFLGGRISGEAAWFHLSTSGTTVIGGQLLNGLTYVVPIGTALAEGVDGDAAFSIMPGWQLIGSFYAGHKVASNEPVAGSYNNSWSAFTRYQFPKSSWTNGLYIGGGVTRIGGRWASDGGLTDVPYALPANGLIKLRTGTQLNGFIGYDVNRHLTFRVSCDNILDQIYPIAAQTAYYVDPSTPTLFALECDYKF